MSTIISTEKLDFVYGWEEGNETPASDKVLNQIDLTIEQGSSVVILGQNGSGKSTLAKCLNALLTPSGGKVMVKGMDTSSEENIWEIRSTVGMVFQNPDNQIVSSIVEEDVAFGPENLGFPPETIRLRVDQALQAVGLYDMRGRSTYNLSGGQKQRVAIAGVLAMKPACVIFDESTAMLDPQGRKDVLSIMEKLHEEGITTIFITHFMEEAIRADRVIIMKDGKILKDDVPEAVFAEERTVRLAGLEFPPAVRIRNLLRKEGLRIPDRVIDMQDLAEYLVDLKLSGGSDDAGGGIPHEN